MILECADQEIVLLLSLYANLEGLLELMDLLRVWNLLLLVFIDCPLLLLDLVSQLLDCGLGVDECLHVNGLLILLREVVLVSDEGEHILGYTFVWFLFFQVVCELLLVLDQLFELFHLVRIGGFVYLSLDIGIESFWANALIKTVHKCKQEYGKCLNIYDQVRNAVDRNFGDGLLLKIKV